MMTAPNEFTTATALSLEKILEFREVFKSVRKHLTDREIEKDGDEESRTEKQKFEQLMQEMDYLLKNFYDPAMMIIVLNNMHEFIDKINIQDETKLSDLNEKIDKAKNSLILEKNYTPEQRARIITAFQIALSEGGSKNHSTGEEIAWQDFEAKKDEKLDRKYHPGLYSVGVTNAKNAFAVKEKPPFLLDLFDFYTFNTLKTFRGDMAHNRRAQAALVNEVVANVKKPGPVSVFGLDYKNYSTWNPLNSGKRKEIRNIVMALTAAGYEVQGVANMSMADQKEVEQVAKEYKKFQEKVKAAQKELKASTSEEAGAGKDKPVTEENPTLPETPRIISPGRS